jgi:hypothetical protein
MGFMRFQFIQQLFYLVLNDTVAVDQFLEAIRQEHLLARQPVRPVEVEKDGTATDKRFDVSTECGREVGFVLWQKLGFASGPFDER